MKDIASIIRLNCNEEIDIKYFTKNDGISYSTCDCSELLDYINDLEDRIDKAIEYINDNRRADLVFKLHLNEEEVDKLLEILKGDRK